jgi:branched-chain amino acid aminotransferase
MIIKNGTLLSPEPRNMLRGISRDYIIHLAGELGIPFQEKNLEPYDVMSADEAFFCCTPFCMVPAVKFNGLDIGKGTIGPIYKRLIGRWSKNVGVDIIGQACSWAKAKSGKGAQGATPYAFSSSGTDD